MNYLLHCLDWDMLFVDWPVLFSHCASYFSSLLTKQNMCLKRNQIIHSKTLLYTVIFQVVILIKVFHKIVYISLQKLFVCVHVWPLAPLSIWCIWLKKIFFWLLHMMVWHNTNYFQDLFFILRLKVFQRLIETDQKISI